MPVPVPKDSRSPKSPSSPGPPRDQTDEATAPADFTRLIIGNIVDGKFEVGQYLGSAMLRGLAHATGFAVVNKEITPAGEPVRWLSLP